MQHVSRLDARHIDAVRRMHGAAAATLDRLDRTEVVTAASYDLLQRLRTDRLRPSREEPATHGSEEIVRAG